MVSDMRNMLIVVVIRVGLLDMFMIMVKGRMMRNVIMSVVECRCMR